MRLFGKIDGSINNFDRPLFFGHYFDLDLAVAEQNSSSVTANDINLTFSGGQTNARADASLGGEPSYQVITNKRLFPDIKKAQAASGMIDYRCFYLNNDSAIGTLYDAVIGVVALIGGEVTAQLGFSFTNEKQLVTITNTDTVSGGYFTLTYTDISSQHDIVVPWDDDVDNLAFNLQTNIRNLPNLEEVTVEGHTSGTTFTMDVNFVGVAGYRFHDILLLKSNDLTTSSSVAIGIEKAVAGGPINAIADEIDVGTTTPNGIVFSDIYTSTSIGDLRPLDSVPVWVKRTIPTQATAVENDGFTFRVSGETVIP